MIKICINCDYHDEISNYLVDKGVDFDSENCLGRCDLCHSGAFAQYNEEFITAENAKMLILKLKALNIM